MKHKWVRLLFLVALIAGSASCYRPWGHRYYSGYYGYNRGHYRYSEHYRHYRGHSRHHDSRRESRRSYYY